MVLFLRLVLFDQEWKAVKSFYDKYTKVVVSKLTESFRSKEVAEEIQHQIDDYIQIREKKRTEELEEKKMIESLILQKQKEEAEELQKKKMEKEAAEAQAIKELEAQKALAAAESN